MSTLIVGDVHGCAAELDRLLAQVQADTVVLVGDLYTKGPDPAGVWRTVRDTGARAVLGNHDARLLDCLDGTRPDDRHGHEVVAALDAEDRAWRDHLRALPLFLDVAGVTVVHAGLHPTQGREGTTRAMALSMRRFPFGERDARHWWVRYQGGPVVYGHDARRGFVRRVRRGQVQVMGLDTGCVYGGALTGWVVEDDRIVSVAAAEVYQPVTSSSGG
jgi:predicted phosphodiesterase